MTVLVCDDHPLVRAALAAAVAQVSEGRKVLTAGDFTEAFRIAEGERSISLCLVDLHMPGAGPIDGLRGIRDRAPGAKLIVVTGSEDDSELLAALDLGVDGFVPKTAEPGVADAAIRLVAAGGRYLPPRVAEILARRDAAPSPPAVRRPVAFQEAAFGRLSDRQREVLRLLAAGRSNKQIAQALTLSPATVKAHVAHILGVLGVGNRTEAAVSARANGVV